MQTMEIEVIISIQASEGYLCRKHEKY